jgi:hypothetical protein
MDLEETGKPIARCLTSVGITTQMRHGDAKNEPPLLFSKK